MLCFHGVEGHRKELIAIKVNNKVINESREGKFGVVRAFLFLSTVSRLNDTSLWIQ